MEEKKKSKKLAIIIVSVIAALAIVGSGIAIALSFNKTPSEIVFNAFKNTAATIASSDDAIAFDASVSADISGLSATANLNGKMHIPTNEIELNLSADILSANFSTNAIVKNNKIYLRFSNFDSILSLLSLYNVEMPANIKTVFNALNNEWLYTDATSDNPISKAASVIDTQSLFQTYLDTEDTNSLVEKINSTTIEDLENYVSIEPYNGNKFPTDRGSLYLVNIKGHYAPENAEFCISIKDNKITGAFINLSENGISLSVRALFDFPKTVNITEPSDAKDFYSTIMFFAPSDTPSDKPNTFMPFSFE